MRRYLCPVPHAHCIGSEQRVGPSGISGHKGHNSTDEVLACQGRYLESQGYTRKSRREYISPEGTIRLLDKRPGLPLRRGKNEDGKGDRTTLMRSGQSIGIM